MVKGERKSDDKKVRILVVEEEKNIRDLILIALSRAGYKVTLASRGEEGLELFCKDRYDLILSNLTMSAMDGWTLAGRIKKKSPDTPFCLMTGWDVQSILPKIKTSSVDFVLFKPFGLTKLKKAIERMLMPDFKKDEEANM
ncbi:MAG: response regulator [Deltaproteobacteria bacterium]|nr:response regulator [Deltaproteobacteria bacterium]